MGTLLWLQGGDCSGNTMSFLNTEEPSAGDLVTDFGIDVIWHPSFGLEMDDRFKSILADIIAGHREDCRAPVEQGRHVCCVVFSPPGPRMARAGSRLSKGIATGVARFHTIPRSIIYGQRQS